MLSQRKCTVGLVPNEFENKMDPRLIGLAVVCWRKNLNLTFKKRIIILFEKYEDEIFVGIQQIKRKFQFNILLVYI